jgi:hypothetical protein
MTRLPKLVCAALLLGLFCAGIGVVAARERHSEAVRPAAVSAIRDPIADPDYVQGLAKLGIVTLP